jgi:hypothetical protein
VQSLPGSKISEFAFSADGALLFVSEEQRQVHALRVFRSDSGAEIARIDGHAELSPLPPGRTVAVRGDEGRWHAVDVASATPDELLWRGQGAKFRFDHVAGRLVVRSEAPATLELPKLPRENLSLAPLVDGSPLNVWAIDADGGRLAALTDAGISVHAADDGRRLADWPGAQLHGGGMSVGPHFRGIRDRLLTGLSAKLAQENTSLLFCNWSKPAA